LALGATIYTFDIELADSDRAVYETLNLRVAQHPSETPDYLLTRVFAYCLEYSEGIGFSKGLSDPDEPAVFVRDLTGALQVWVRHRPARARPAASRQQGRAARRRVYTQGCRAVGGARIREAKIHRAEKLEAFAFDRVWLSTVSNRLERRMKFSLARSEGEIYLTLGHGDPADRARAAAHITRHPC
jgi:uncharacterized protein YaeQ